MTINGIAYADELDDFTCLVTNQCDAVESEPGRVSVLTPSFH